MTGTLSLDDFDDFHQSVHGYPPYRWQTDLLAQVVDEGRWPQLIDLPTGAGKTSVLDIGLFHLALEAGGTPSDRRAPLRMVFVVDRRVVVDQVSERARLLSEALDSRSNGVCSTVAAALRSLSGDGPPLCSSALRGGIIRDEEWARRPDVPAMVSSTVDQVGSRMLFRGYGISPGMAPVHAGLLANDTILFLDEVHLSQPFAQTLAMLGGFRTGGGRPVQVVELSATPGEHTTSVFPAVPLDPASVADPLRRRLVASKPCRLEAVTVPKDRVKADVAFAKTVAAEVKALAKGRSDLLVGVVVNRVDTARRVFGHLESVSGVEPVLLTGRMRPMDRDAVMARHAHSWVDRDRRPGGVQVLVATQCIEAGADFDLDVLVTESASFDALRQRFGRVDRRGAVHATGEPFESVILNRGAGTVDDDAVYGSALGRTWAWLCALPHVDFGIGSLPDAPPDCLARRPDAPLLTKVHLHDFVQTSPRPHLDQDPSRWLHGPDESSPSVSILWRRELGDLERLAATAEDEPERAELVPVLEAEATGRLAFFPPSSLETIELPLWAARQWLSGEAAEPVADTDQEPPDADQSTRDATRPVFVWRSGAAAFIDPTGLRPGDVVVLAPERGGIGPHANWDPDAVHEVDDVADAAARQARGRELLRLGRWDAAGQQPSSRFARLEFEAADGSLSDRAVIDVVSPSTGTSRAGSLRPRVVTRFVESDVARRVVVASMETASGGDVVGADDGRVVGGVDGSVAPLLWFVGVLDSLADDAKPSEFDVDDVDDEPSFTGPPAPVELDDHLLGVGALAADFARRLGLEAAVVSDLELAGRIHDLGKADPRFQRWLKDDADPAAVAGRLLAKSPTSSRNRAAMMQARDRSGYPAGMRHELLSLALAESAPELWGRTNDPDLVAHLVLSHHGYCRPLPPPVLDDDPVEVEVGAEGERLVASSETGLTRIGSGVVDRFWRLVDRYDPYGLAYLEAVLRLADHWRSALEAAGTAGGESS